MRQFASIILLAIALLSFASLAVADAPVSSYLRSSAYNFKLFPGSADPWEQFDESTINLWETYSSILNGIQPSSGTFSPGNSQSEIAGFLTSSQTASYYGFSWSSGVLGVTAMYGYDNTLYEADMMFNPSWTWTTDWEASEDHYNTQMLYQHVLLHELGHTFGLADYHYKSDDKSMGFDSVMNYAYLPWRVQTRIDDVLAVQNTYPGNKRSVHDMGVFDFACSSKYDCSPATVSTSYVQAGKTFKVSGFQVENLGNYNESDVEVSFYLSKDRTISSYDTFVGSAGWDSFDLHSRSTFNATLTVPADAVNGTYYVGAIVSMSSSDALDDNNSTWAYYTITVNGGTEGDDDDDDDDDTTGGDDDDDDDDSISDDDDDSGSGSSGDDDDDDSGCCGM